MSQMTAKALQAIIEAAIRNVLEGKSVDISNKDKNPDYEDLLAYAKALKENCDKSSCVLCPFDFKEGCKLRVKTYPANWEV